MALNDDKWAALKSLTGLSLSSPDLEWQWLKTATGLSGTIPDLWHAYVIQQGYPTINNYLGSLGYTGTISDRENAYWKDRAGFVVPPVRAIGIVPSLPTDVTRYNAWNGKNADLVNIITPGTTWTDFFTNLDFAIGTQYGPTNIKAVWTFSFPSDKTLANVASGSEHANYVLMAQKILVAAAPGIIRMRPMHEAQYANTYPYSAPGHEVDFKAAFRNIVNDCRSVSNRFVFDWCCAALPDGSYDPMLSYPGDDVVDVIGMDPYWMHSQGPVAGQTDPTIAFNTMRDLPFGFQWQANTAASRGKSMAWSEYGTDFNSGVWLGLVKTWVVAHNFAWVCYFDTNFGNYATRLSDQDYALWDAGDAYITAFGVSSRGPRIALTSSYNSAHLTVAGSRLTNGTGATTFEAHYLYQVMALPPGVYEVQWAYKQVSANTKRFLGIFIAGSNQNSFIYLDSDVVDVPAGGKTADLTAPIITDTLNGKLCTSRLTVAPGATDISIGMGPGVAASGAQIDFFDARIRAVL